MLVQQQIQFMRQYGFRGRVRRIWLHHPLVSVDSTYRLAFVYFFNSHRAGQFRR